MPSPATANVLEGGIGVYVARAARERPPVTVAPLTMALTRGRSEAERIVEATLVMAAIAAPSL